MALVYGAVCKGDTILTEFPSFPEKRGGREGERGEEKTTPRVVTHHLLKKREGCGERKAFQIENERYFMKTKGVMSIIVCEKQEKRGEGEEIPLRIPFACIEEIESTFDAFLELEPTDHTVFSSQMEQILEIWNSPDADILSATKKKVIDAKAGLERDIVAKFSARGEQLDNVEEICEELNEESFLYKKGTKEMNDKLWWRRFKSVVCGVIVVIVILVVVICLAVIVAG